MLGHRRGTADVSAVAAAAQVRHDQAEIRPGVAQPVPLPPLAGEAVYGQDRCRPGLVIHGHLYYGDMLGQLLLTGNGGKTWHAVRF